MIRTYALRLCTILGIPIMLDATFGINVLVLASVIPTVIVGGPLAWTTWILCAYVSLLAHEFAHVGTSYLNGVGMIEIRLHMLGATGVPKSEQPSPKAEILTAASGPAMSLLIGIALAIPLLHLALSGYDIGKVMTKEPFVLNLALLSAFNIILAAFNLVPLYPMDGGRILRGTMSILLKSTARATHYCAMMTVVASFFIIVRGGYSLATHRELTSLIPLVLGVALGNYALKEMYPKEMERGFFIDKFRRRGVTPTATTDEIDRTNDEA